MNAVRAHRRRELIDCLIVTPQPSLCMLWESADPAAALTARFEFADTSSAVGWLSEALCESWAIRFDYCDRVVISAANLLAWIASDGRRLIGKLSVEPQLFQRLADTATLTAWLHARDVPVAGGMPERGRRGAALPCAYFGCSQVFSTVFPVRSGRPVQKVRPVAHWLRRQCQRAVVAPIPLDEGAGFLVVAQAEPEDHQLGVGQRVDRPLSI